MKISSAVVFLALGALACMPVFSAEPAPKVEKVIPTEVSQPPYKVGDLVTIQGYYIERPDLPSVNFRIVGNKLRVYWIDEDGLIAEPEASIGTVRFTTSTISRGRPFYELTVLPGGAGLGAGDNIQPPHIFNVILGLGDPEAADAEVYTFRFNAAMNEEITPEIPGAQTSSGK